MDPEITLLAAARKLNEDALAAIFELYAPILYKYALRLYNDGIIADRLVGDVFERFVQQLSAGQNPGVNLRACLYEIAHNFLLHDVRYASYFLSNNRASLQSRKQTPLALNPDDQRITDAIQWALFHELTTDQRYVVLLRFIEGFSLKETAAITGKKINHVKVIQNRGIRALRKSIDLTVVETQNITLYLRRIAQMEDVSITAVSNP